MANEITTKRTEAQVFELADLRTFITQNDLEEIKIIKLGTSVLSEKDKKSLCNKAKRIQKVDVTYDSKDTSEAKIEKILDGYNLKTPENSYYIATKGRGEIHKTWQANLDEFKKAIIDDTQLDLISSEAIKYAVFIDDDVKPDILRILKPRVQPTSEIIAETADDMLNATQQLDQIEQNMSNDPVYRFEVLSKTIESTIEICEVLACGSNPTMLTQLQELLKHIERSTLKARYEYQDLSDSATEIQVSLTKQITDLRATNEALLVTSETKIEELSEELRKTEDNLKECYQKLQESDDTDESEKLRTRLENVELVKQKVEKELEQSKQRTESQNRKLQDLENELEKVKNSQKKTEDAYNEQLSKHRKLASTIDAEQISTKINQSLQNTENVHIIKQSSEVGSNNGFVMLDTSEIGVPKFRLPQLNLLEEKKSSDKTNGESSQTKGDSAKSGRGVICKLSNFGLNTWNPSTTDLNVHLDTATKAGEEALQVGCTKTSVRRMILNSLGEKYRYVEGFLKDVSHSENTIAQFTTEITKILGKKPSTQMHDFLLAQRKSGEDLLAYFARLCRLYKASANFDNDQWEQDPSHTMSIYSKIYDSCYSEQKSEFIRKTEDSLAKRTLTLPELRSALIDVNQLASSKMNAEEPEINNLNGKTSYMYSKGQSKPRTFESKPWYEDEVKEQSRKVDYKNTKKIDCWYCGKTGHVKAKCYRYLAQRSKGEKIASPREPETHGSR